MARRNRRPLPGQRPALFRLHGRAEKALYRPRGCIWKGASGKADPAARRGRGRGCDICGGSRADECAGADSADGGGTFEDAAGEAVAVGVGAGDWGCEEGDSGREEGEGGGEEEGGEGEGEEGEEGEEAEEEKGYNREKGESEEGER